MGTHKVGEIEVDLLSRFIQIKRLDKYGVGK